MASRRKAKPEKVPRPRPTAGVERPSDDDHANIFVIGDLVIDHTVFVTSANPGLEPVAGENAFQVQRRLDTAGGAATAARTISIFSEGVTFLWGLLGTSRWGTFRSILENSQALDGATRSIELRGTQDETSAPMSTVSRLVLVQREPSALERYARKARFVDSGKVHVAHSKLTAVAYHLKHVHRISPLDAIVLDDLNAGALDAELVTEIYNFAAQIRVPLIIRVRHGASKYDGVGAKAIVCTLAEWVHIAGGSRDAEYWKTNIGKPHVADELARRSLYAFPDVDNHVILVGDNWIDLVITVERSSRDELQYQVIRRMGSPQDEKGISHQVGTSDVFTGVLAVELTGNAPRTFGSAIGRASQVAADYQRVSWHRIPQPKPRRRDADVRGTTVSTRTYGTKYLPRAGTIETARAKTYVPGVLSVTPEMKDALDRLSKDVESGEEDSRSMILMASGGSGKTFIGNELINIAKRQGRHAMWFDELKESWNWSRPKQMIDMIRETSDVPNTKWFVAVDEVLKLSGASAITTKGVVLLNTAKEAGIRFLFIDADFSKARMDGFQSQFGRRCSMHVLPSAWQRARDIPYVMAHCLRPNFADHPPKVEIETAALVATIEWMLEAKRNFGDLDTLCKQIARGRGDSMLVAWDELPASVRGNVKAFDGFDPPVYRVTYD